MYFKTFSTYARFHKTGFFVGKNVVQYKNKINGETVFFIKILKQTCVAFTASLPASFWFIIQITLHIFAEI